jgi:hypothetical protein
MPRTTRQIVHCTPVADVDNQQQEEINHEPPPALPIPDPPYVEVALEDIVSHVESLPNCHEPAYETVCVIALLCIVLYCLGVFIAVTCCSYDVHLTRYLMNILTISASFVIQHTIQCT